MPVLPSRLPRLGLRARITLAFAIGAALLSALLAATTWALTRENLLDQRVEASTDIATRNALSVRNQLVPGANVLEVLASLTTAAGSRPAVAYEGEFTALQQQYGEEALRQELRDTVISGEPARMRYELRGEMTLAIGVPIPSIDAAYFEIVSLDDVEQTLEALSVSLIGASVVTTLAGAGLGWYASKRALRPLSGVSTAATSLAAGRLDTRLEESEDPDLAPITTSFNDMAQALQDRIERDARFASDVSHELRSPLMTLAASIEVLDNQRHELPDRAVAALDLMQGDVERFRQLVEDLLEISRFDAGIAHLELAEVHLAELVMQAVSISSADRDIPVELDAELAGVVVLADKRRLVRVIANLLENAEKYGGGATSVALRKVGDVVQIAVEDRGPGVPDVDRTLIFDRFSRGVTAGRRGSSEGVGLGLALVSEHTALHGGRVWVEGRADGQEGARFVVELPVQEET